MGEVDGGGGADFEDGVNGENGRARRASFPWSELVLEAETDVRSARTVERGSCRASLQDRMFVIDGVTSGGRDGHEVRPYKSGQR